MEERVRLVIVGCGMAAGKLVEEIGVRDGEKRLLITVIGDEPGGNYDRIRLADQLDDAEHSRFWLNDEAWFKERGITTLLGDKVVGIDNDVKSVTTRSGKTVEYDQLVLATGSRALVPNIEGVAIQGVFTLRNLEDAAAIRTWLSDRKRVTVMGGGVLGLELADKLVRMGKTVTVSHLMDTLMEQQLNREAALVLEKRFIKAGVTVEKENPIVSVVDRDGGLLLKRKDGTFLETDALVINCGIVPNVDLVQAAGLAVDRGIVVDETLRTSAPNIYALGECIEFDGALYGLVAPVYAQARVLSDRLCGIESTYRNEPLPMVKLKSEIPTVAMGVREPRAGDEVITYDNPCSLIHKKLIVRDNMLVGAHLVGDVLNADALSGYYASKLPLPNRMESLIFPGVKPAGYETQAVYWPLDVSVCDCNGISARTVRDAVRHSGRNIKVITEKTRAAVNCGTCLSRVESIVDSSYDAIVVGAGLGGLSAAARLAKADKRVLVIERHDQVGGYATSFTREGYTFDVSLHNLGPMNSSIQRIFENLGLDKRIEYVPFDCFTKVHFPGFSLKLPKGYMAFIDELKQLTDDPEEKAGLDALAKEVWTIRKGFEEIEMLTLDAPGAVGVSPLMAAKYPQFSELIFSSFGELQDKYIKSETIKGLLCNVWWYLGLPPSEMAAILYAVVAAGYIEYGGGVVKGTSQNLSNALRDVIMENGGEIRLNTEVTRILSSDGKVEGVLTNGGEMFYADLVLSNAGAINTFKNLVSEPTLKKKYLKKTTRQENSLSAIQLYVGLDCSLDKVGAADQGHGFAVFESYDHEANYQAIVDGAYDKIPLACMLYSNQDQTLAPDGCAVLNILSLDHIKNWEDLSRSDYEKKKRMVIDTLLTRVETYLPGLKTHAQVKELGTPMTMRRYTANPDGAIFGPCQNVYQSGLNRLQAETPIAGLYLVGSSIYPGGGYPSVINSGYRTAHLILEKEKSSVCS